MPFHQKMRGRWDATILDVSSTGLRWPSRPVAVNSVLEVKLGTRTTTELVLVRWIKAAEGDTLIVGCRSSGLCQLGTRSDLPGGSSEPRRLKQGTSGRAVEARRTFSGGLLFRRSSRLLPRRWPLPEPAIVPGPPPAVELRPASD